MAQLNTKICTAAIQYLHAAKFDNASLKDLMQLNEIVGALMRIVDGEDVVLEKGEANVCDSS